MIDSRIQAVGSIQGANDQQVSEHGKLLFLRDERQAGRLIECLDDGFVRLVDVMGNDSAIVEAARQSYGLGTKATSTGRALIRRLMRKRHTSPFEQVEFKFHIRIPMDHWRQWIRHRTANVNEYSTRYSEAIDAMQEVETWRLQDDNNKQGSMPGVIEWPNNLDPGANYYKSIGQSASEYLSLREKEFHKLAREVYEERLQFGVAREQARKDLLLSNYTEAFWKIDLHNLLHFLGLRLDDYAQLEIRTYAVAISNLIKPIVPVALEAFEDYQLNAITLSVGEQQAIMQILHPAKKPTCQLSATELRELDEKLERLGILYRVPG